MTLRRREVLAAGAFGLFAGRGVHAQNAPAAGFTHGVASGDPQADRVILWTRFVPSGNSAVSLIWELSATADFARVLASGRALAAPERDWCAKADAAGLRPGQRYHFRFRAGAHVSPAGQTRTLPRGPVDLLRLAVFSCSNYGFGHFNAYAHAAARDDLDAALHLGDYIYEYGADAYPAPQEAVAGRTLAPDHELLALGDYRQRYALYRSDPDLQALHARLPFICVWDDHEIANDAWRDGAQNHQDGEGPWTARRRAAVRAWHEWLPVRESPMFGRIYRRFDWGNLASLIMLDTRLIGRDRAFSYPINLPLPDDADDETVHRMALGFLSAWQDMNRTLLGKDQETWLDAQLRDSTSRGIVWQVLGQQVVMASRRMPALPPDLFAQVRPEAQPMARARARLGAYGLPLSFDDWSGYPAARHQLVESAWYAKANLVVLSGDSHNAWAAEIPMGMEIQPGAVEFAAQAVTSPGLERLFAGDPAALARLMLKANPELKWCDTARRGYLTVTLTADTAQAEWLFLRTVQERSTEIQSRQRVRVASLAGPGTGFLQVDPPAS